MKPLANALRPTWPFGLTVHDGYYEQACSRNNAGRPPERYRNLYRMRHTGIPGQIHAVHEPAARVAAVLLLGDEA